MIILSLCGCSIGSWNLTITLTLTLIGYLPSVYLSSWTWSGDRLLPISSQHHKCSIWSIYFVAVLVVTFPIQCVVLGILFLCFCGGFLGGALSSSLHSLICLFANIFWIVFGIICLWANGRACPLLLFVFVVSCRCILHLPSSCLFVMGLVAVYVPFIPVLFLCIMPLMPWCIVPLVQILLPRS